MMVIGKLTGIFDSAKEMTSEVAATVIDGLEGAKEKTSEVAATVIGGGVAATVIGGTIRIAQDCMFSERIESIKKQLDDSTPDFVKDTSRMVVDSVDVLTGIKLLEVVQEMLQAQEEYNNVLATKLDEALTRIAMLEAVIQKGVVDENR